MLTLVEKLQRKPERVRKQIALFFAGSVTGIIVIFWLVSWAQTEPSLEAVATEEQEQGPFEALTHGLGSFFSDTGDMIVAAAQEFRAPQETVTEVTPEVTAEAESGEVSDY